MLAKTDFYSVQIPKILNRRERLRVGKQILSVICYHLGDNKKFSCLDIGCSSGVITNYLTRFFKSVVGVDIDLKALVFAENDFNRKNLKFFKMDATKLKFKDENFDVVIANQLYEFVEDDAKVFSEIYRVLKKGGICFLGARNKFAPFEAQYNIPFLSWLPRNVSDKIVRFLGKGNGFVGKYRSYWQLKNLVKSFKVHDYTIMILRNPLKYGYKNLEKYNFLARILPLRLLYPFIPNYIWILEKPSKN